MVSKSVKNYVTPYINNPLVSLNGGDKLCIYNMKFFISWVATVVFNVRLLHAFVLKVITLVWANQSNYFKNANACSNRTLKTTVATQLQLLIVKDLTWMAFIEASINIFHWWRLCWRQSYRKKFSLKKSLN